MGLILRIFSRFRQFFLEFMQRCPITAVFQAQVLLKGMESILFKTEVRKIVNIANNFLDFDNFVL